jgi:transcriptional regulator with XRE-family HTH domain
MSDLTAQIARRIKMYRKQRNMSVSDLARRIGKSAATLYKYESGQIPVDMDVLNEISKELGVAPIHFFDLPREKPIINQSISFLENGQLYAYYYDGRIKHLSKSFLTFSCRADGDIYAMFYMHLKSFEAPEKARYLYSGKMISHETVSYFILENITLPIETLTLQILHPFQNSLTSWGLFMGMSDHPATPMATKMLFSKRLLTTKEIEQFPLTFTKEEMRKIRSQNALLLSIRPGKERDTD